MTERILLLVDDDENISASLVRLLRRDKYTILRANGGLEGLALLTQHKVGVIISDQRMPGMTGTEFLSKVKELYPDTVRVVLSGYTELNSVTDAINRGAVYKFLTKPWEDDLLRANIEEAFHHYELKMENARLAHELQLANDELKNANYILEQSVEWKGREIMRNLEVLRVSQEMLEVLPMAALGIDKTGMIVIANQAAHQLFSSGETWPTLLGESAHALLPPDLITWMSNGQHPRHEDARIFTLADHDIRCWVRSLGELSRSQGTLLVMDKNQHSQRISPSPSSKTSGD